MEEQEKKERLVTRMKCYAENTKFIGKVKLKI